LQDSTSIGIPEYQDDLGMKVETAHKKEKAKLLEAIGTPIKIGKILVAENDFLFPMTWDEAQNACEIIGEGWRLPTIDDFKSLDEYHYKIGRRFSRYSYWSSNEVNSRQVGTKRVSWNGVMAYKFAEQGSDNWRISKHFGNIPEGKGFQVEKNLVNRTFVVKDF